MSNFIKSQQSFDSIIDLKLNKYYNSIPREKFFMFFHKLNYFIGYDKNRTVASVHNTVFVKLLGTVNTEHKRIKIFPKLLQILKSENVIEHSTYHYDKKYKASNYTRKYWYSDSFKYDINNLTMENIEITSLKDYKKLSKLYNRPIIKHLCDNMT